MNANQKFMVITGAGILIGMGEALLYYNMGKNAESDEFTFGFPRGRELVNSLAVVLVTSTLTAVASNIIENALERGGAPAPNIQIA